MNFYDNNPETTGEMLERFFPGRDDVKRLLMERLRTRTASTIDDPAITTGSSFQISWARACTHVPRWIGFG